MNMKKPFFSIAAFCVVICAAVSCSTDDRREVEEKVPLPSPAVTVLSKDATSFSLVWGPVAGAVSYSYRCDWTEQTGTVEDTVLSFSDLLPDSSYRVYIAAHPAPDAELFTASPETEVVVELVSDAPSDGAGFDIEMYDNAGRMVMTYVVTPDDPDMLFYRDAFTDVQYDEFGGNPEDVWTVALQGYLDFFGSSWIQMVAESGRVEAEFSYVWDQRTYILVAGVDSLANRITPVVDTSWYSGPVPPSDVTFEVTFENVGTSSAVVWVTPSNNDPWSMLLMESDMLEAYSEEEIEDIVKISYGDYINDGRVYSGRMSMTYHEGQLNPDTEYSVLVFGWNTTLSTGVSRHTFRTERASSSQDLTFTWNLEVLGPMEIHAVVTPSDMDAQYIVIPMPDYDYEEFGTDIDAYIEYVTMGVITPYYYTYMFATTGVTDRVFNEFDDGIYPGSSYMFMAVGVDMDNANETVSFYEPQLYGDMVTTPAE